MLSRGLWLLFLLLPVAWSQTITSTIIPPTTTNSFTYCGNQTEIINNMDYSWSNSNLADNQTCFVTFTWDAANMAQFSISSNVDINAKVTAEFLDSSQTFLLHDLNGIYWPPTSAVVYINIPSRLNWWPEIINITVSVNMTAINFTPSVVYTTIAGQQPIFVQVSNLTTNSTFIAQSTGKGTAFAAARREGASRQTANCFIYDGSDKNRKIRGTWYSISLLDYDSWVSTGQNTTIYIPAYTGYFDDDFFVMNDAENVNQVDNFWADQLDSQSLDNDDNQTVAVTLLNTDWPNVYLELSYINSNTPNGVSILAGGLLSNYKSAKTTLCSTDGSNKPVPQVVAGFATTIVLQPFSHVELKTYDVSRNNGDETQPSDGRTGFLMSNNYPFSSSQQDSYNFYLTSNNMYFTLTYWVTTKSSNSDAYLHVSAQDEPQIDTSCTQNYYTNLQLAPVGSTVSVTAKQIIMTIFGGKATSNGALVYFSIKRVGDTIPGNVAGKCPLDNVTVPYIPTTTGAGGIGIFIALLTVFSRV